jgi:hypothetical protein
MSEIKNTFMRYEIKYMVTDEQRWLIEHAMRDYMSADEFGENTICNVYYDTLDYRLIRRSLEKPIYKEKLRVRSYGAVGRDEEVYLELKKKYNGVVYKRRLSLAEHEVEDYIDGTIGLPSPCQIGNEIAYFRKLYGFMVPSMYICYDRSPFFSKNDPNLRITFDRNILFRKTDLSLRIKPYGEALLQDGYSLMEIKTAGAFPLWLTHLLTKNRLVKTSFSKYGTAYCNTCKTVLPGGRYCA